MSVYTGRGDDGETDLADGERIRKTHPRIESYGTVDELNALIGAVRPVDDDDVEQVLMRVQQDLHVLQAHLANPDVDAEPRPTPDDVDRLEARIDTFDADLDPLTSFVLPGGGADGSRLHHARTVCRRAERRVIDLAEREPVADAAVTYLNRLSDLLFVLARVRNARDDVEEESPTY